MKVINLYFIKLFFIGTLVTSEEQGLSINHLLSTVGKIIHEVSSQNNLKLNESKYENNEKKFKDANELKEALKGFQNMKTNENVKAVENTIEDRMCKKYGRCGCGSPGLCGCGIGRCSPNNNVDKLEDDINIQLVKDMRHSSVKENSESLDTRENRLQFTYYEYDSNEKDKIQRMVTDPSDVKTFLKSLRNKQKHKYRKDSETNLLEALISEIFEITSAKNENQQLKRYRIPLSPNEISKFYNEFKDQVIERIFNYVKDIPPKKALPFLTLKPRREFRNLKALYKRTKMDDLQLEREIIEMLLGKTGNMKIYPHRDRNLYEIVVPKWVYVAYYKMRKNKPDFR